MGKEYLGEFEELILTLVAALQDDAYVLQSPKSLRLW